VVDHTEELTNRLLDSFAEVGGINHIGGIHLPSKSAIARITQRLLHLLFPGFYDDDPLGGRPVAEAITAQIEELRGILSAELAKSLDYRPPNGRAAADFQAVARETACTFLSRLPAIREILSTDVEAAYEGDPAATSFEEIILSYPGIEAIAVQRLAHELHRLDVALIPRMMTEWAHARTGIDIHPGATIGSHFFIDHGTGVVIGETCEIGRHVKIYHGVTLGAKSTSGGQQLRGRKRHPTIGDRVTIYPGVTVLGGDTVIGSGSTIGGNVFLIHSVPPDHLVFNEEHSVLMRPKSARDESLDFQI
jgi:serine O-acetyltransferase